ncbi:hypothetical protein ACIQWR_39465 [Streptomyces sp. NPDC098789]|uniref:hypothetical protein n=1 Tax=Streptomyces sp. NPDC098789 TaxID=3366098 RepID=UPI0038123D31
MEHRIRLAGAPESTPELACLRIIAQLPSHWTSEILECGTGYAVLGLRVSTSDCDVTHAIDRALAAPALHGWTRGG